MPYKAKPLTEASAGAIDRDVLQPGTPRTSVTEMFGNSIVATGPHLTWARVQFSDSGVFIAAVGSEPNAFFESDGRYWHAQNLMIEFDEQDRVRRHRILGDAMLQPAVEELLSDGSLQTPIFTPPVTLTFAIKSTSLLSSSLLGPSLLNDRTTGRLTLSEGGISWSVDKKAKIEAAPAALTNVRHRKTCPYPETSKPERMNENLCTSFDLQTSEKPLHVTARVSARDLFMLVAYARKSQHAIKLR